MAQENKIERIKSEIRITDLAKQMGFTVVQSGRFFSLKEHDSVRIYPETNTYYQFSSGTGGSPIDFLMNFANLSKKEAIIALKSDLSKSSLYIPPSSESSQ